MHYSITAVTFTGKHLMGSALDNIKCLPQDYLKIEKKIKLYNIVI